jgi:cystathionine beta-lyase
MLKDGRYCFDFENLEKNIDADTKLLILCSPHNPGGMVWKHEELQDLGRICLQRGITIISDEIHSDLILPGNSHTPAAKLSEKIAEITVTCIAPSKTFNLAGLSTSSVIIPNPVLRKYFNSKIEHLQIGNGNIFGTVASIAAYSEGSEWLDKLIEYLNLNTSYVIDYCREFIPEIIPVKPEATYMIWLDCRKLGMPGKKLGEFFVSKAKVGMNEGSSFGPGGDGFMRMNIATTHNKVIRAMESIRKAVESSR